MRLDKEDSMWNQRSRLNWIQAGDRNTTFFHSKASSCFQRNTIDGLFDQDNVWKNEDSAVQNIILNYYDDLFKTSNPMEFSELIDVAQPKVSSEMNAMLTTDFQEFKVCRALKQMYHLKSPGPDGMPPLFFQHFCPTIGGVVSKTILDFLNLGVIPP